MKDQLIQRTVKHREAPHLRDLAIAITDAFEDLNPGMTGIQAMGHMTAAHIQRESLRIGGDPKASSKSVVEMLKTVFRVIRDTSMIERQSMNINALTDADIDREIMEIVGGARGIEAGHEYLESAAGQAGGSPEGARRAEIGRPATVSAHADPEAVP